MLCAKQRISHYVGWLVHWLVSYDSDDDDNVNDNEDSYGDKKKNLESNGRATLMTFLLFHIPRTDVFATSFSSIGSKEAKCKQLRHQIPS